MNAELTARHFEASGLNALIRAGERENWFLGHLGAALLAGAGLLRNQSQPAQAKHALAATLSRLESERGDWYGPLEGPVTAPANTAPLLSALGDNIQRLRTSGHGTIYLVAALRALERRPRLATRRCIEALLALHKAAQVDDATRYLGCDDYFALAGAAPVATHKPTGLHEAISSAFRTCRKVTPDITRAGRRHFLFGEKIHALTHLNALLGLAQLGHGELAFAGLTAQAIQVELSEVAEHEHRPAPVAGALTPAAAAFWQTDGPDVWHKIKLAEAVTALLPLLPADERAAARRAAAGMWALLGITSAGREARAS